MSDLLTDNTQSGVDSPAPAFSTPLPPPPPISLDEPGPDRRRLLAVIGAIAILAALAFGLLWATARSERNSAVTERDAAQAAVAIETDRSETALSALSNAEADLEAATETNDQLTADLATAETAAADAADATTRAADAETSVADLTEQNDLLLAEIAVLQSSVTDANDAADLAASEQAASEAAATPATAPVAAAEFNPADAVDFSRFIGEAVSSINGASVLGDGQKTCLGTAMINAVGIDALGAGLSSGASASAKRVVTDAVDAAAIGCGIDPSAVL